LLHLSIARRPSAAQHARLPMVLLMESLTPRGASGSRRMPSPVAAQRAESRRPFLDALAEAAPCAEEEEDAEDAAAGACLLRACKRKAARIARVWAAVTERAAPIRRGDLRARN
jgi:hypothetical protein